MKHRNNKKRLGRITPQRKALERNLLTSLVINGKVTTTEAKAKYLVTALDELANTVRNKTEKREQIRHAKQVLFGEDAQRAFFEKCIDGCTKTSGITRTAHLGPRKGDGAEMIQIEICS